MKLSKILESIREELKKPLPEPRVVLVQPKRKRKAKMGKKAKKLEEDMDDETGAEEGEESGDEEDEAPAKSKKSKKSKDKAKKAAKSDDDEGFVTIGELAEEAEIEPQSARVKLREAELERPEGGRWRWKEGSKALKAARKAVGLSG